MVSHPNFGMGVLAQAVARRRIPLQIAGTLLALLVGPWSSAQDSPRSYQTPLGEHQQFTLQDGTVVDLNTSSELEVRFSPARRDVVLLRGEALFHVSDDQHRPFVVKAADTDVRAVGTTFSVYLRDDRTVDVLVSEGRASIAPSDHSNGSGTAVMAGDFVRVNHGIPVSTQHLPAPEIERKLAWMHGQLAFEGATLAQVADEFNRYNLTKVTILDDITAHLVVGGIFMATDLDSFSAALRNSFDLNVSETSTPTSGREIRVGPPPAKPTP